MTTQWFLWFPAPNALPKPSTLRLSCKKRAACTAPHYHTTWMCMCICVCAPGNSDALNVHLCIYTYIHMYMYICVSFCISQTDRPEVEGLLFARQTSPHCWAQESKFQLGTLHQCRQNHSRKSGLYWKTKQSLSKGVKRSSFFCHYHSLI